MYVVRDRTYFDVGECQYVLIDDSTVGLNNCKTQESDYTVESTVTFQEKTYKVIFLMNRSFNESMIRVLRFREDSYVKIIGHIIDDVYRELKIHVPKNCELINPDLMKSQNFTFTIDPDNKNMVQDENETTYCTKDNAMIFRYNRRKASTFIRESIEFIYSCAFYNHPVLKRITFPSSMREICPSAFRKCYRLRVVNFSEPSKLRAIMSMAFSLTNIRKIKFPNSLKYIGSYAFDECKMEKVIFPADSKLKRIAEGAFELNNFTSIDFPASLESFGQYAFRANHELTSISFPQDSRLKDTDYNVFYNCTRIRRIECSDSVAKVLAMEEDITDYTNLRKRLEEIKIKEYYMYPK